MERYLIYDSGCSVCTQLAQAVGDAAGGKIRAISIRDDRARELLDRAYPNGWAFAPYLVAVDGDRVRAWTGAASALRLARMVGPLNAWSIWRVARRNGVYLPPTGIGRQSSGVSRRGFLKLSAGITGAVAVVGANSSSLYACTPCEPLPYPGCGLQCSIVQRCVDRGDCFGNTQDVYCDKQVCRDARSGAVCSTRYINCNCLPSCG